MYIRKEYFTYLTIHFICAAIDIETYLIICIKHSTTKHQLRSVLKVKKSDNNNDDDDVMIIVIIIISTIIIITIISMTCRCLQKFQEMLVVTCKTLKGEVKLANHQKRDRFYKRSVPYLG